MTVFACWSLVNRGMQSAPVPDIDRRGKIFETRLENCVFNDTKRETAKGDTRNRRSRNEESGDSG